MVFLLTFLKKRKEITSRDVVELKSCPSVTVIVPCWNEENTIDMTVESVLAIDYPHDLFKMFLVDDGSTDRTWEIMQKYRNHPRISIFQKENGGKHTAVNLGIEKATSEFVSCLDADSFVHPQALKRIMSYFENDPTTMAVCPSIVVHKPKGLMQIIQRVEYEWAVFIKKMLGVLGANYVTPGPFSVYRRAVFEKLGYFRKAHNTEDMEIAFRMQKNRFKIDQCNDAFVYTTVPNTVMKLYRQRLRWLYGFIMNCWDYRKILFRRKFGAFSMFSVPAGIISMIAAPYILFLLIYNTASAAQRNYERISVSGIDVGFHFDPFFISTGGHIFLMVIVYALIIAAITIGKRMATGKAGVDYYLIPYMIIFSVLTPIWILRAAYSSIIARKGVSWR